jgi:antirestriction protein
MNSYKNGLIYGRWIDATISVDHIKNQIADMLSHSVFRYTVEESGILPNERDWWEIHSWQQFHGINLYRSIFTNGSMYIQKNHSFCLQEVHEIAKEIDKLQKQGEGENKVMIFISLYLKYDLKKAISLMSDKYLGCFDSEKDFITSYSKKMNLFEGCKPEVLEHFDYHSLSQKFLLEGTVFSITLHGKHHYFSNE